MSSTHPGRRATVAAFMLLAAVGLGASVLADDSASAGGIAYGLSHAPVPLNLKGLDRALVAHGSYIVNAQGDCNGCHSRQEFAPGGDPVTGEPIKINKKGYLAGGREFGPGIVSANLTPDEHGLPGGMTYKKYLAAIRLG